MKKHLSKRLLSLFVVVMVMSLLPTVFAVENEVKCPKCDAVTWNEVATLSGALTTDHYKLTANVSLSAALTVAEGETVCIDLNGHNITGKAKNRVFENSGTLVIQDSVGTGVISGGTQVGTKNTNTSPKGGNIYNYANATFALYSGTVSGGQVTSSSVSFKKLYGGNIYGEANSVIEIHGGTVKNGKNYNTSYHNTDGGSWGANIYSLGTVKISGGTVTQDEAYTQTNTNAVHTYNGRPFQYYGQNIAVGAGATLQITGGTISNGAINMTRRATDAAEVTINSVKYYINGAANAGAVTLKGGNIYADDATVEISGNAQITGGSLTALSEGYSGYSTADQSLLVTNKASAVSAVTDGMKYPASAYAYGGNIYMAGGSLSVCGGVTISGGSVSATANNLSTFKTDKQAVAYADGGNICIDGDCEVTFDKDANNVKPTVSGGSAVTASTSTLADNEGSAQSSGGNICFANVRKTSYYSKDTVISTVSNQEGFTGTADLKAGTISAGSAHLGGNLIVYGGTGTVTLNGVDLTGGTSVGSGGSVHCRGTIIMNDGSISGGTSTDQYGGNVYTTTGGSFTMNNGKIYNGTAERGGNIYMMNKYDEFNMYDGEIYGGTATVRQRNVAVYAGEFNMYGGKVYASGEVTDDYTDCLYAQNGSAYINIYGGTVDGANGEYTGDKAIYAVYANVKVEGGTITGCPNAVAINASADTEYAKADISGGTLKGKIYISHANSTMTVSGGTIDGITYNSGTLKIQAGATLYEDPTAYLSNCVALHDASEGKYVTYAQLAGALTASGEGDTVTLGMDVADAGEVELKAGVTLDLNGKTLAADSIDAATNTGAHIVDNNGTGKLAVDSFDYAGFAKENNMLPVAVDGGYAFETPVLKQGYYGGTAEGDETQKISFYIANEEAKTAMKDAAEREGEEALKIGFFVTYAGNETGTYYWLEKDTEAYDAYLANWDTKMIVLTLTGCDTVTNLEVKGCVQSGEVVVYYEVSE